MVMESGVLSRRNLPMMVESGGFFPRQNISIKIKLECFTRQNLLQTNLAQLKSFETRPALDKIKTIHL